MTKAAELQPQAAFAAFSKSLQAEWIFLQELFLEKTLSLLETLSYSCKKAIERKWEHWCSDWFLVLPTTDNEYYMIAD